MLTVSNQLLHLHRGSIHQTITYTQKLVPISHIMTVFLCSIRAGFLSLKLSVHMFGLTGLTITMQCKSCTVSLSKALWF